MSRYPLMQVCRIAERAAEVFAKHGVFREPIQFMMDIEGCNTRLDLDALERYDDANLVHDLAGVIRYLDRDTGDLTNYFRPRSAVSEV